jgi:adenylate kinase family enzyme
MAGERILVYGNSGSGKTTMARALAAELGLVHLDLDAIAWGEIGVRKPLSASIAELHAFIDAHATWVIEGCYGTLVEAAAPFCTELRFLDPGVDACIRNCRARPWEPHKYPDPTEQERRLAFLLAWVRGYDARTDEFSAAYHEAIFAAFDGQKRRYDDTPDADLLAQ